MSCHRLVIVPCFLHILIKLKQYLHYLCLDLHLGSIILVIIFMFCLFGFDQLLYFHDQNYSMFRVSTIILYLFNKVFHCFVGIVLFSTSSYLSPIYFPLLLLFLQTIKNLDSLRSRPILKIFVQKVCIFIYQYSTAKKLWGVAGSTCLLQCCL